MMMEKNVRRETDGQQALSRLAENMERVRREFAQTQDEDLMEACAFELKALEARYRWLLRRMREDDGGEENSGSQEKPKKRLGRIRICGTGR